MLIRSPFAGWYSVYPVPALSSVLLELLLSRLSITLHVPSTSRLVSSSNPRCSQKLRRNYEEEKKKNKTMGKKLRW